MIYEVRLAFTKCVDLHVKLPITNIIKTFPDNDLSISFGKSVEVIIDG